MKQGSLATSHAPVPPCTVSHQGWWQEGAQGTSLLAPALGQPKMHFLLSDEGPAVGKVTTSKAA